MFRDQQSLCAYCEIRMIIDEDGADRSDFRVEHFIPKKPHNPPPNHAATWSNMLGCCHGGASKAVAVQGRFTAPDLSCDAIKGNKNLLGVIINPLSDISDDDFIFGFLSDGSISVSDDCPGHLVDRAGRTIVELGLDAARLRKLRRAAVEATLEAIETLMGEGLELAAACEVAFPDNSPPEFYSCIKSVLGSAAEPRLQQLNYYN
ncbi:retron system putative HNH endonuclease [Stenotrophomonas maltophilia]|uniref:retron system putative HNH endonuclease n=1 Tax=Stenotrophomonas maltophilia TaxID=40324 RepID=UPI0021B2F9F0|nr:retron system putative HNH endonuclease [Stenotrophomonas maltophilia]UXB38141.1 TIGR02646 family protein [Stenotrophomonas maltophilia]